MPKPHLQKCTTLLLSLVLCFGLVGCTTQNGTPQSTFELGSGANTPEEAVDMVMQAYFNFDKETLHNYIIPMEDGWVEEFLFNPESQEWDDAMTYVVSDLTAKQSYIILNVTDINEHTKSVTISLSYYDSSPFFISLFREWISIYNSTKEEGTSFPAFDDYFYEHVHSAYSSYTFELCETELMLTCEEIDGRWYVQQPDKVVSGIILANMIDFAYHIAGLL